MLLFRRDKKKREPEKVPLWFVVVLGGFIIYAVLSNLFNDHVSEVREKEKEQGIAEKNVDPDLNFLPVIPQRIGRDPKVFHTVDIDKGRGLEAGCWESVSVRYALYKKDGTLIEDNREEGEAHTFTIGKGEVIPSLERGVMGMRKGGYRHIVAHPEWAYSYPGFTHPEIEATDYIGYKLVLEDISRLPSPPETDMGFRVYDDKDGTGRIVQCTDEVKMDVLAWNMKGERLWVKPKELTLRVGTGAAPYAIEMGVIGMRKGGTRSLVVPPGYMKSVFPSEADEPYSEGDVAESAKESETGEPAEVEAETTAAEEALKEMKAEEVERTTIPKTPGDEVIILQMKVHADKTLSDVGTLNPSTPY